jgi:hypothetical protein
MWHTHSVGYYSAFKKRIPSSVHKWTYRMLYEMKYASHRKTNIEWDH